MPNIKHINFVMTQEIIDTYVSGEMTVTAQAESLGVSKWFLVRKLAKLGIKEVDERIKQNTKANYCDESQKIMAASRLKLGWKVDAIALECGLSNTTIRKIKRNIESKKEIAQ